MASPPLLLCPVAAPGRPRVCTAVRVCGEVGCSQRIAVLNVQAAFFWKYTVTENNIAASGESYARQAATVGKSQMTDTGNAARYGYAR